MKPNMALFGYVLIDSFILYVKQSRLIIISHRAWQMLKLNFHQAFNAQPSPPWNHLTIVIVNGNPYTIKMVSWYCNTSRVFDKSNFISCHLVYYRSCECCGDYANVTPSSRGDTTCEHHTMATRISPQPHGVGSKSYFLFWKFFMLYILWS